MYTSIHRTLTEEALKPFFSPQALGAIVTANQGQDRLPGGQIGHPEYHFDHSSFASSRAYLEANRAAIQPALAGGDPLSAWRAFGRLTHLAQDFYAHSNYVALWLAGFPEGQAPVPSAIEPLEASLLESPELHTGKIYQPFETLCYLPGLKSLIQPLMPADSHARMNLDGPGRGPLYPYAYQAAIKRTRFEYRQAVQGLPPALLELFHG
jgi:hypothetical protein